MSSVIMNAAVSTTGSTAQCGGRSGVCSARPRTVGCHLYKACPKLGVAARSELPDVLRDEG
jgi:hypothetical protein